MASRHSVQTVCVPFIRGMLRMETHGRVLAQWKAAELRELPATSPTAYAKLLVELWARPGDLVIVEQDVVPPPGSIRRLLRCRHLWCTHATPYAGHVNVDMLGLARFSSALKQLHPRGMEAALCRGLGSYNWPHWRSCDHLLAKWLRLQGIEPHVHRPDALHLHDFPLTPGWEVSWPLLTPADENPHAPAPEHERTPAKVSPAGVPSDVGFSVGEAGRVDHPDDDRRDDQGGEGAGDDRPGPEHDPDRQRAGAG